MSNKLQKTNQPDVPLTWYANVLHHLTQHMWHKAIGTTVFITGFFWIYLYLLKNPAFATTEMPVTLVDTWIKFQAWAMPVYLSLWFYVSLPPALLATRRELYRYAFAIGVTCSIGLIIFYFWPTTVPNLSETRTMHASVEFLKSIDASGNACPSLHVATALFSAIWLHVILRNFASPTWVLMLNWIWCLGILYSTLAVRQHVLVDVLAGILLGALGAFVSLSFSLKYQRKLRIE